MLSSKSTFNPVIRREQLPQILVLDDDPHFGQLLDALLGRHYRVVTHQEAYRALAWLHQGNLPDLMIIDLEMAPMDGCEFIRGIKTSGFFQHIPVLATSGEERPDLRKQSMEEGALDMLVKPFNPQQLLDKIAYALN